jgi:hypothetical protein
LIKNEEEKEERGEGNREMGENSRGRGEREILILGDRDNKR